MKYKIYLLSIVCCLLVTVSEAQNWLLVGNNPTAAQFLGTTTNTNLRFRTNNTEKMVILSAGNVGIGNTAPAQKLDVTGTIKSTGLIVTVGTPAVGKFLTSTDANGTVTWTTTLPVANGGTGQTAIATGDILYGSATNVLSRRAAGTNGQVLTLSGGLPVWATPAGGGSGTVTNFIFTNQNGFTGTVSTSTSTPTLVLSTTLNGLLRGNGTALVTGQANLASEVTGTLPTTNGGTGLATIATGDILYGSATNVLSRLTAGVAGRVLTMGSTGLPEWAAASGGGAVSSVFNRTGIVVAQNGDYTFAQIGSKPTTLSGYGITDAIQNTTTQQPASDFNISGNGTIGGKIITPRMESAAASIAFDPSGGGTTNDLVLDAGNTTFTAQNGYLIGWANNTVAASDAGFTRAGNADINVSGGAANAFALAKLNAATYYASTKVRIGTTIDQPGYTLQNENGAYLKGTNNLPGLTASLPLKLDASKNIISGAVDLSGTDVTGNLPVSKLNSGTAASATTFWRGDGTWATPAGGGTGTVTSVSVVSANGFAGTVATPTVTPAITLTTSVSGILKGSGGSLATAVAGDFPTLNQNTTGTAANVTGVVGVVNGGTGLSSIAAGDIYYGSATNVVSKLTAGAVGRVLTMGSTGLPEWAPASGGGAVSSVFGRTGAVVAQTGDYTFAQIGSKPTTLSGYGITDAIQNTTSQQASSNFNISGNGTIGNNLTVAGTTLQLGSFSQSGQVQMSFRQLFNASLNGWNVGYSSPTANDFQIYGGETGAAFRLHTNSSERFTVLAGGNVGIGTSSPAYTLDVKGTTRINDSLFVNTNGTVAIGTVTSYPSGYKLAVAGNIIAEKVRVKLQITGWPDYVFNSGYELPTLKETEQFINTNKHLPGVPSAATIEKEGLDLGDGQAVLLRKIEELTLHLIEMDKKIEKLAAENETLKKKKEKQ
jgi:hypothetical protein